MNEPTTKRELMDLIRQEQAAWDALLAEVGEARMTEPGVTGDWTFKDVAAHLTAWRQRAVARLQAAARGEAPTPAPWAAVVTAGSDDFEPVNQWIYQANRDRPLPEVLRDSRASLRELEQAAEALSEPDLMEPGRFPGMEDNALAAYVMGNSMEHYFDDHGPAIRAWLSAGAGTAPAR
jgi:hypothetical protein